MNAKEISILDYTYQLPEEKIAVYPLPNRDQSKLLIYKNGEVKESIFENIPTQIAPHSLMVFNNTKVIHARLHFQKESGATIEVFCLEPANGSHEQALQALGNCQWHCLLGNAKRWKGETLKKIFEVAGKEICLQVNLISKDGAYGIVAFEWEEKEIPFGQLLNAAGQLPIPPYLNRETEANDEEVYQTLYAKHEGSVAAPTAGLHFTEAVFEQLKKAQISKEELTLHVGAGTFLPVKSEHLAGHEMHRESVLVSKKSLEHILEKLKKQEPIIAVGTTSLRTLESLYWHGVKTLVNIGSTHMDVEQWDPYELTQEHSAIEALEALIQKLEKENSSFIFGSTQILIAPGYSFKLADGLLTNFHQPNSTLLLLVAAFIGDDWKKVYQYALENNFRFLSFGDSSLLWRN